MARMLPSYVSQNIKSSAELQIFDLFKNDKHTEGWIVLHSLGISEHSNLIYGEVDFLVLAPGYGVFALEVKGGRVKRQDGIWYFTDRNNNTNTKSRGPFEQASEGIFSIMKALKHKFGNDSKIGRLLFGCGIMFPDIVFDENGPDYHKNQIFDSRNKNDIFVYISNLSHHCVEDFKKTYGFFLDEKLPDNKDVKTIANFLRGDFDKPMRFHAEISEIESKQKKLTAEQFICLDALEDNPRCLIQGGAGTGKTILAIENTFRSVDNNNSVILICYNHILGNHLKSVFSQLPANRQPYFVGTYYSFLMEIIMKAGLSLDKNRFDDSNYWDEDIPLFFWDAIKLFPVTIDKIIVDESQDILSENNLEIFDALLKDGFDRGKWTLFGDFSNQAIYNIHSKDEMIGFLESRSAFINYKLQRNCRNTVSIGSEIKTLTGYSSPNYLDESVKGPPVNYFTWRTKKDEAAKIRLLLNKLISDEKIPGKSIIILSPLKYANSIVSEIAGVIPEYNETNSGDVAFCTIYSFKGMEKQIVLLVDIEDYKDNKILYIGLSRAKSHLFVFESEIAHKERSRRVMGAAE